MKTFRLPRKTKKSLKGKLWLYPADEKGNSLMAHPRRSQEDYLAVKSGIVTNLFDRESPEERKAERKKLDQEIYVSDEDLKKYVCEIFAKEFRNSSYMTLIEAKNTPRAKQSYFNFVNAYHLVEKGDDSFGNICCLTIDLAKRLLKRGSVPMKKSRKRRK